MKAIGPRPVSAPWALVVAVGVTVVALAVPLPATAAPVLFGGQFYYTGGDLTIDVIHQDSAYDEVLQLRTAVAVLDVANGWEEGSRVSLTAQQLAAMGVGVGDELRFGVNVLDTGNFFALGEGKANDDGVVHAYVRATRSLTYYVGFEDLLGGGDLDFNDTIFRFSGGLTTTTPEPEALIVPVEEPVPEADVSEPSALLLFAVGGGILAISRRRS